MQGRPSLSHLGMKSRVDGFVIDVDDPTREDVRSLLEQHLTFARGITPPDDLHALDLDGLLDSTITFFSLRVDGELLGVGAIKQLDPEHAELKSMHTALAARRHGVGRAIVDHLVAVAAARGVRRVSLETGARWRRGGTESAARSSTILSRSPPHAAFVASASRRGRARRSRLRAPSTLAPGSCPAGRSATMRRARTARS